MSDFSVGPVELVLTCGHLSVTVSWFYKCLACLTEMVSYSILHGGVLQAVQAAASAASSFSYAFLTVSTLGYFVCYNNNK